MSELGIRNSACRSIRNVQAWSLREHDAPPTVEDYEDRLEYLQSTFSRFITNQNHLVQRAIDGENEEEEEEHHQLLDQTEEEYLETRARLLRQMRQAQQMHQNVEPENENEHSFNEDDEIPLGQQLNHENLNPNANEPLENNVQQPNNENNANANAAAFPNVAPNEQPPQPQQFGNVQPNSAFLQQPAMNPGRPIFYVLQNGKIENTWGEFDGTLSKFQGFHDRFKWAVHDNNDYSPAMKFQALWSSLKGKALEDLGEWSFSDVEYAELWDRLQELYQRKFHTSSEILSKFTKLKKIERASGPGLQKLSNVTNEVLRQLRALRYPIEQWDLMFVHGLQSKLDPETSRLWEMQRLSETPTAKQMLKFLDHQASALGNHSSNESKPVQENAKRPWPNKNDSDKKRFKPNTEKSSGTKFHENDKCSVCKEIHTVFHCETFRKKNLTTRKKTARELNLCFNCLRPSHTAAECKSKPCSRCNKKHNSLLCNENPLNHSVNAVQKKAKRPPKKAKKPKDETQ